MLVTYFCLLFKGSSVGQVIVGGNDSQIQLSLASNEYGFLLNATTRSVIVGQRLRLSTEDAHEITVILKISCSHVGSSFKEVSVSSKHFAFLIK